jgi:CBS domain-containing protein
MTNKLAERIVDFLSAYPPFSKLTFVELIQVAESVRVINLEKNKILFQVNDPLHDYFYVVASGKIILSVIVDAEETILSKCVDGDIFGLRPFFAKNNYMMTATAKNESIVYAIPVASFRPYIASNSEVLDFLLQSFASTSQSSFINDSNKYIGESPKFVEQQTEIQFFQALDYNKNPLLASSTAIVQHIAQTMTDHLLGYVIIHENNLPIGIITDADLRAKIATGKFYITTLAHNIMTSPVITVPENISLAEAQLIMLSQNITHLCVTEDGSDTTIIKGVISQQNLIAAQANNPGILIKQIKKELHPEALKKLRNNLSDFIQISLDKSIPLSHIYNIAGEVTMAFIKRAIDLSILDIGSPPCNFAWLSIGSQGRKEQLLLTDQDSMLIFEDVGPDHYKNTKEYFLKLSKRVTSILETIGYGLCPHGHMASNTDWCKSLSEWIKQYNDIITNPGEKSDGLCGIFFDYEFISGDVRLEEALTNYIFNSGLNKKKFFAFLGTETLKRSPPLSFFKQFNLEENQEHNNLFDIKTRAIVPLIDAARLLVLSHNVKGINNTYSRFKQLSITEPKYAEIYLSAGEAFLTLSKFRTLNGLNNNSTGQYVNVEEMAKSDKEKLKSSFAPMKDLEEIIKNKFQLTYFS